MASKNENGSIIFLQTSFNEMDQDIEVVEVHVPSEQNKWKNFHQNGSDHILIADAGPSSEQPVYIPPENDWSNFTTAHLKTKVSSKLLVSGREVNFLFSN